LLCERGNHDEEDPVKNTFTLAAAATTLVLIAGCGSSSNTTTTSTSTGSSAPATTAASSSGATGAYGHATTGASASSASAVVVSTKHGKLGTILAAGPKKLTVYLFEGDKGGQPSCSGACASAWPPVTTANAASVAGAADNAMVSTITRPDGTKQVTYNGHPLYYFDKDKDDGDAYGQGVKAFGAEWYVLTPSGKKVDES
jgi:predicted lipoprotein with Yx(FWY)xxD motif